MALTHDLYTPRELAEKIGADARAARLEKKLSRKALAEKAGLSEYAIKQFETGGKVALDNLLLIATALGKRREVAELFKPEPLWFPEVPSAPAADRYESFNRRAKVGTGRKPPPPDGYDSWIRYAVETFDARSAELPFLFDFDEANPFTRDEIRLVLRSEFNTLREAVGLPLIELVEKK